MEFHALLPSVLFFYIAGAFCVGVLVGILIAFAPAKRIGMNAAMKVLKDNGIDVG